MPHTRTPVSGHDDGQFFSYKVPQVDRADRPVAVLNITGSLETLDGVGTFQLNIITAARQFFAVAIEDQDVETRLLKRFVISPTIDTGILQNDGELVLKKGIIGCHGVLGMDAAEMPSLGHIADPDGMCTARRHHRDRLDFRVVAVGNAGDIMFVILRTILLALENGLLVGVGNGAVGEHPAIGVPLLEAHIAAIDLGMGRLQKKAENDG